MIAVSDAWKELHKEYVLPETFLEISCGMTDIGVADLLSVSAGSESFLSNTDGMVRQNSNPFPTKYATLEHNLWLLDGTRDIAPDEPPYNAPGYVSADDSAVSVVLTLPEPRGVPIPGFTILWSTEYGEYPTEFSVIVKNGNAVVGEATVTDNRSTMSEIALELVNYDRVEVIVSNWCLPDRRTRIERVAFGHVVTFYKKDILSYSHEQHGCLNSGELPKNSINFALVNTDGRWNPSNPEGIGKYLSERQQIIVRYGMRVGRDIEWIDAGKWYLSEWKSPANGLEASFVARDVFEYMLNTPYTGTTTGTYSELIREALRVSNVPDDFVVYIDPSLDNLSGTIEGEHTCAEVIQLCANAGACVLWQDRSGVLNIAPHRLDDTGITITSFASYAHPEVELSKPLKCVVVDYAGEQSVTVNAGDTGEAQTLTNTLISTPEQATQVANWVLNTLSPRKNVTGDFRADPRVDLYDVVTIESKYGSLYPAAITNIKYSYTGSFRATYTAKMLRARSFVLGESVLGVGVL